MDERTSTGKLRQKAFARHMNKSEAWLSNVLSGKRGLRIVDLDKVADFFHLPVSELVRESDAELVEVTPSEQSLLRKVRRMNKEYRDGIYLFAGLPQPATVETERPKTGHAKKTAQQKRTENT
jgi:transcriptional regulator with XRE-family HTH domain